MKTLTTSVVLAVTFCALLTSVTQGQLILKPSRAAKALRIVPPTGKPTTKPPKLPFVPPDVTSLPKGSDKLTAVKNNRRDSVVPKPYIDVLGQLEIISFSPSSAPAFSPLKAVIRNKSIETINATYTISQWNGRAWANYTSGAVTIRPKTTAEVATQFRFTGDTQRFRIVISGPGSMVYCSKECHLDATPKTTFVFRYKTRGWVLIADQTQKGSDQLIGAEARKNIPFLNSIGFRTEVHRTTNTGLFGDSYRTMVYARLDNAIERTFDTREERDAFAKSVKRIVPTVGRDIDTFGDFASFER
jgi:hypothetical protein